MSAPQPDFQVLRDPRGRKVTIRSNRLSALVSANETNDLMMTLHDGAGDESRTELDSHGNMPVVGENAYVLANTGKTVDVTPFTPDYKSMCVPLADAAIQYMIHHTRVRCTSW